MRDKPKLGPVAMCVLVTPDGQAQVDAYTRFLHQQVSQRGALDSASAEALGFPDLAGHATWVLANSAGREWLQFVEYARATPEEQREYLDALALLAAGVTRPDQWKDAPWARS